MSDTYVYVDGFNLYYGLLRGTPDRWLDINQLCHKLLPNNKILKIKYFTAKVSARPSDPGQPGRQQTYLRALKTLPNIEIYFGHFLAHQIWMPLSVPFPAEQIHANRSSVFVRVMKTEEKGSDVNIAAHMLRDAYQGQYETAAVISNDSDLLAPIQMARRDFQKQVGVLSPHSKRPSAVLKREADFFKPIRRGVVASSQFPATLADTIGKFSKPVEW